MGRPRPDNPAPIGRPTKRTPEVEELLLTAIANGQSVVDACANAGIGERTFYDWVEGIPQFSQAVTQAQGQLIAKATARLAKELENGMGDWRAAIEVLKRRRPAEWGDRVTHELDSEITNLLASVAGRGETQA